MLEQDIISKHFQMFSVALSFESRIIAGNHISFAPNSKYYCHILGYKEIKLVGEKKLMICDRDIIR